MVSRRALITGVTGQDGSYLAEILLGKGYKVYGLVRRTANPNTQKIDHLIGSPNFHIVNGDMTDQGSLIRAVAESCPDEVYNLAAQSYVGGSWQYPVATSDINGLGTVRLLEALREHSQETKFYQASTSEMFGNQSGVLDENASFRPRSPYGFSKVLAHNATINYRESYGLFACCGILFNHESPRRGNEFVTKKIVNQAVEIRNNKREYFELGDLSAKRDWGYARDYVEMMWLMLQQDAPEDFVIGTGVSYTCREFLDFAAEAAGLKDYEVKIDPRFVRPAEINDLKASTAKAEQKLGWSAKTDLKELIQLMVDAQL